MLRVRSFFFIEIPSSFVLWFRKKIKSGLVLLRRRDTEQLREVLFDEQPGTAGRRRANERGTAFRRV